MNLLHIIFNAINPDRKVTWLSQIYHRWESARQEKRNREWKTNDTESILFDVPGAGEIRLGKDCHTACGGAIGFDFGVEWGKYGFCGGVLGRDEAKRMAEYILKRCSETEEPMKDEYKRTFPNTERY